LREQVGLAGSPFAGRVVQGPGGGRTLIAPDLYVEIRDTDDEVLATGQFTSSKSTPDLPDHLTAGVTDRFLTVASRTGSGDWRVLVEANRFGDGTTSIVAVPLTEVSGPLNRLVIIEILAGGGLLAVLGTGSWLILRRGLRPLEQMADSASSITAGNLSERVAPSDPQTEVGRLGLALNTMLAEIEDAFRERDATEHRLRQFLADASHELRTPLTSIQGFAELFRMGGRDDRAKLAVILRRIEEESERMKTLVEELLLLARLDETRAPQRVDVDLAVLAADACSDASAIAPDRPVTLDAPSPVVVSGDRDHLRQAIANLVANALTHTPAGTPVEVGAVAVGEDALVTVRDHGTGLDAAALEHAFDRFGRADGARVGTGTGLGLAIVAAIADEHDGTVAVENRVDGGACFTIRLPLLSELRPEPAANPG
jgi:two-component system OmpR family sensor kinase